MVIPQVSQAFICPDDAVCGHGMAAWGDVKYPENFTHFDYVNPDAPKGGTLRKAAIGSFDSLNPFILKGVADIRGRTLRAVGVVYDSLTVPSKDDFFSQYGLLAKRIALAKDRSWVRFYLHEHASFHDGHPITAEDVIFSFDTLMTDGHPRYRIMFAEVEKAEALSDYVVQFSFKNSTNRELPFILGEGLPILPKHYYQEHAFDQTSLEPPLGSGPYVVDKLEAGRWIHYRRADNYWGKDLPVNKGHYNFDVIEVDYYKDATIAIEAFKAGEFDIRKENVSKMWNMAYNIPAVADGRIIKQEIPHLQPANMQSFVFNTRKPQFQNRLVRQAISHAFDFEWTNANLFNDAYTRNVSFFGNTVFQSTDLPNEAERILLEPFRDQLPPELFDSPYQVPVNDVAGSVRANLLIARDLLQEAGWEVTEGVLRHRETAEPLHIEFLLYSPFFERVLGPMIHNLKKLGITASIRQVDRAQYIKRIEQFDYDMLVSVYGATFPGNEQINYWHSDNAVIQGSYNLVGTQSAVLDALVEHVVNADSKTALITAARALDRVLLHMHYVIPQWHLDYFRVVYWDKFSRPETTPDYALGELTWWAKEAKE